EKSESRLKIEIKKFVREFHHHRCRCHLRHSVAVAVTGLRRGETKSEKREGIASSPAEQKGKPPPPSIDVVVPW
ncbi:hypothetical protein PIB30_080067, partial [Stylosanthes scabra]|nr:hypothetical protein [Stylosanthes scabra]